MWCNGYQANRQLVVSLILTWCSILLWIAIKFSLANKYI